jgi:hypothetical protein
VRQTFEFHGENGSALNRIADRDDAAMGDHGSGSNIQAQARAAQFLIAAALPEATKDRMPLILRYAGTLIDYAD